MPTCQKCWRDASCCDDKTSEYLRLIEERDCTPEEQAGRDAPKCPECKRNTIHEIVNQCMNCGFNPMCCNIF